MNLEKAPHFPQVFLAPNEAIFKGTNNEMTNTMTIYIHLHNEEEEEPVESEFVEEKSFTRDSRKNW